MMNEKIKQLDEVKTQKRLDKEVKGLFNLRVSNPIKTSFMHFIQLKNILKKDKF